MKFVTIPGGQHLGPWARWLVMLSCLGSFLPAAQAEMDPRVKVVTSMAVYGTVGGAFLGTASLAFGTDVRTIFIGGSLGLYAGILFGSYIVLSYTAKKNGWGSRQNTTDYYPGATSPYGGGGASGEAGSAPQRWNPYGELKPWRQDIGHVRGFSGQRRPPGPGVPFFVPVFHWDF